MTTTTRTRIFTAIAALAVVAGIVATVLSRGGPARPVTPGRSPQASSSSSPAAAAGPVTPVTGVAGLRWVNDQGYLLPESAQAGPRYTSGGLASGFADTPLGALVAMINIAVRTAWQFGPAVFQPTIEAQVTGPYANQMLSMDLDAYGTGPGQAGQASSYARMTGYQWAGYTPADATADLVEEGPADDGTTIYAAIQIQAQWVNGGLAGRRPGRRGLGELRDPDRVAERLPHLPRREGLTHVCNLPQFPRRGLHGAAAPGIRCRPGGQR
jgi:hypothetical protein